MAARRGQMKGLLIAISGTIILMSSLVYSQSDTQAIDQGNMNHGQWIERSFDRGQLDRREEARPERQPAPLDRTESRAKTVTKKRPHRSARRRSTPPGLWCENGMIAGMHDIVDWETMPLN